MDPAAAANLASKNAVIVCDAAFGRLHFKEGERGDAVLYEPLMLSSKGGAELQVDVADEPKGAKDKKGNTQMRDTCIASAKHDDTRARFLISRYNAPSTPAPRSWPSTSLPTGSATRTTSPRCSASST